MKLISPLPQPQIPPVNPQTGLFNREWYEFFSSVAKALGGLNVFQGTGDPEGAVIAPVGSLFLRYDGGSGSTLYVKEANTDATGWVAK